MEANKLYQQLERDFVTPEMSDDWWQYMGPIAEFISDNYKRRSMGMVCDFAQEINKVYTAVFPSNPVMEKILVDGTQDAMLFVHHPAVWDIRKSPAVFAQMNGELLASFKERNISIFNIHVPLDNFGKYSTSVSLAKALGIDLGKTFAPYLGALCGVFGKTDITNISELRSKFQEAVGHKVSLCQYGSDTINGGIVAVVAGGGNSIEVVREIADEGVNAFVTGVSAKNDYSKTTHEFLQEHKINILGGTHYSTEKFACMAMVDYFKNLGLIAEFLPDRPVMEDMFV